MRNFLIFLLLFPLTTQAHEFWLDPVSSQVPLGDRLDIDIRVGTELDGAAYPFLPQRVAAMWISDPLGLSPLAPRIGDQPALQTETRSEGAAIIGYQSQPSELTYESFDAFTKFLRQEGLDAAIARHTERGLPEAGFNEYFTRYAKTLVHIGERPGTVPAQPTFRFDLTLLGPNRLQLSWEHSPLPDHPVFLLTPDGGRLQMRTGPDGIVLLPESPGPVLVNSVLMEEWQAGAPWHSHWASFYLPDQSHIKKNAAAR